MVASYALTINMVGENLVKFHTFKNKKAYIGVPTYA
jgi:hypothetical protein